MGPEMKYECIFKFVIIVTLVGYAQCNKIKQLQRQVQLLAGRQHIESITSQENVANIFERLNSIEMLLNDSQEERQCCNCTQSRSHGSDTTDTTESFPNRREFLMVMKAFKAEKAINAELRRQVRVLTEELGTLDENVGNMTQTVSSITSEINTTSETNMIIKTEMEDLYQAVQIMKNEIDGTIDKTDRVEESVENISRRVDKIEGFMRNDTDVSMNRLGDIENSTPVNIPTLQKHTSCLGHYEAGSKEDGVYIVYLTSSDTPVSVYCDMTTDGGGWTVFQRKTASGSVDFGRGWQDYKLGFGDLKGEFWLGNNNIAALTTKPCCHELRVDMRNTDRIKGFVKYGKFQVLPETSNYKLIVDMHLGNMIDGLKYHNNMEFTTKDRDNDWYGGGNCATQNTYASAWWYKSCIIADLNRARMYWNWPNKDILMSEMKLR